MRLWWIGSTYLEQKNNVETMFWFDPERPGRLGMRAGNTVSDTHVSIVWLKEIHTIIGDIIREVENDTGA